MRGLGRQAVARGRRGERVVAARVELQRADEADLADLVVALRLQQAPAAPRRRGLLGVEVADRALAGADVEVHLLLLQLLRGEVRALHPDLLLLRDEREIGLDHVVHHGLARPLDLAAAGLAG